MSHWWQLDLYFCHNIYSLQKMNGDAVQEGLFVFPDDILRLLLRFSTACDWIRGPARSCKSLHRFTRNSWPIVRESAMSDFLVGMDMAWGTNGVVKNEREGEKSIVRAASCGLRCAVAEQETLSACLKGGCSRRAYFASSNSALRCLCDFVSAANLEALADLWLDVLERERGGDRNPWAAVRFAAYAARAGSFSRFELIQRCARESIDEDKNGLAMHLAATELYDVLFDDVGDPNRLTLLKRSAETGCLDGKSHLSLSHVCTLSSLTPPPFPPVSFP